MGSILEKKRSMEALPASPVRLFFTSEGRQHTLRIESQKNETGVLFRICAVLFAHGFTVLSGKVASGPNGIEDEFTMERIDGDPGSDQVLRQMVIDFERLLFHGVSVLEYLQENQKRIPDRVRRTKGTVRLDQDPPVLRITGSDQPGLLLTLSQAFFLMDLDIEDADIRTDSDGLVRNVFHVNAADTRLKNAEFRRRLVEELTDLV